MLARGIVLVEREAYVGGNAASFTDEQGFTWDTGGHVICSHYPYFDRFMSETLGEEIEYRPRHGWVWLCDRYIPFPIWLSCSHPRARCISL